MLHMSTQCYEHRFGYCTNVKTCFNVHFRPILAEKSVLLGRLHWRRSALLIRQQRFRALHQFCTSVVQPVTVRCITPRPARNQSRTHTCNGSIGRAVTTVSPLSDQIFIIGLSLGAGLQAYTSSLPLICPSLCSRVSVFLLISFPLSVSACV